MKKLRSHFGLISLLSFLVFMGCGSGSSNNGLTAGANSQSSSSADDSTSPKADPAPPEIAISSPAATGSTTTSATVVLKGFSSDDVTSVNWASDRGGSGTAQGTGEWTTGPVTLLSGDNQLTVTGATSDQRTAAAQTLVVLNPLAILSPLSCDVDTLFVNEAKLATFQIQIQNSNTLNKGSVQIIQVDETNQPISTVGNLVDSGGNFIFSGQFNLTAASSGRLRYRVSATTTGGPLLSEIFEIPVVAHISAQELTELEQISTAALTAYDNALQAGGGTINGQLAALAYLVDQEAVIETGPSGTAGLGVWFILRSKLMVSLELNPDGTRGSRFKVGSVRPQPASTRGAWKRRKSKGWPAQIAKMVDGTKSIPDFPASYVAGLYADQFGADDEYSKIGDYLHNASPISYPGPVKANAAAFLADFRSFSDKGVVYITSHGDTAFNFTPATRALVQPTFKWNGPGAQVLILTRDTLTLPFTPASISPYEADLRAGRICFGAQRKNTGDVIWTMCVLPKFIDDNYRGKRLKDALVSVCACRSTYNTSMAYAFLRAGAATYTGYSEYVSADFGFNTGTDFYDQLLNQKRPDGTYFTTGQAYRPQTDPAPIRPIISFNPAVPVPTILQLAKEGHKANTTTLAQSLDNLFYHGPGTSTILNVDKFTTAAAAVDGLRTGRLGPARYQMIGSRNLVLEGDKPQLFATENGGVSGQRVLVKLDLNVTPTDRKVVRNFNSGTGLRGLARDSQGNLIVCEGSTPALVAISPDGLNRNVIASGLQSPNAVRIDTAGNYLVADGHNLDIVPAGGGAASHITTNVDGNATAYDLALDGQGNAVMCFINTQINISDKLIRVNLTTGAPTTVFDFSTLGNPAPEAVGVGVDSHGNYIVCESYLNGGNVSASVVRITPGGGRSLIASFPGGSGGSIAVDQADNIYLLDNFTGQLTQIPSAGAPIPLTVLPSGSTRFGLTL